MKFKHSLTLMTLLATTATILVPLNVRGQSVSVVQEPSCIAEPQAYIPPGTIAMLAYRGAFEKEGIPGYNVFVTEFNAGNVTADKIIQAAVTSCVLSNKYGMSQQENFIADVKDQVQLLIQGK